MRPFFAVTILALALGAAGAARAADADHGLVIAKRWCAACHVVSDDQTHGQDIPPPFAAIAKIDGFGADKIAQFLLDPHPRMPDMQLTRQEAQDLAAYIASLKR